MRIRADAQVQLQTSTPAHLPGGWHAWQHHRRQQNMEQPSKQNAKPLSVQLYALRRESARDFNAVLTRLSEIGYAGVELFNLFGMRPDEFRRRVEGLGMRISSSQFPCANRAPVDLVVDTLGELGLTRATCEFSPDDFRDHDAILRTAEIVNTLAAELCRHGIRVLLQNHWWEYETLDAELKCHMLQALSPDAQFAIDTYWAANFGRVNVPAEVRRAAARTPMLIIKDGLFIKDDPFMQEPSAFGLRPSTFDLRRDTAARHLARRPGQGPGRCQRHRCSSRPWRA